MSQMNPEEKLAKLITRELVKLSPSGLDEDGDPCPNYRDIDYENGKKGSFLSVNGDNDPRWEGILDFIERTTRSGEVQELAKKAKE